MTRLLFAMTYEKPRHNMKTNWSPTFPQPCLQELQGIEILQLKLMGPLLCQLLLLLVLPRLVSRSKEEGEGASQRAAEEKGSAGGGRA